MSEFSLSSTTSKKPQFSSLLLSDLFLFCSFILSHPIYFFYFIFLFPYLFKILSFLSPLFITTFLLLLVLLTVSPNLVLENLSTELPESKVSFVLGTYQAVVEKLQSKVYEEDGKDQEFNKFVELEAYKIVFEASNYDIGENPIEVSELEAKENILGNNEAQFVKSSSHESSVLDLPVVVNGNGNGNENSAVITKQESSQLIAEEKKLGFVLHQKQKFEEFASQKEEKEVKQFSENSNKGEEKKEETYMRSGSKAMNRKLRESKVSTDYDSSSKESISRMNSQRTEGDSWSPDYYYDASSNGSLGSFGSMRKEKEWRRTLACKLFEERHNVDGGEGMDLLWETYETDSMKVLAKSKTKKGSKNGKTEKNYYYDEEDEDEDEDEDDDEDESNGKLCCLQALKFSAGKMNLGMGRPNLVKISKAIKGIGWLHNVTKHGKKNHH